MRAPPLRWSPGHALLAVALATLVVCVVVIAAAVRQPWLGMQLVAHQDTVRIVGVAPGGPSDELAADLAEAGGAGLQLLSLGGVPLLGQDLLEEPDFIDAYEAMDAMFARQTRLHQALQDAPVLIEILHPDTRTTRHLVLPAAARPVSDLPAVFWFQLFCGAACLLIGVWVWVLRPSDWATRMFALTGLMFPFSTFSAAIYSTRELAIDGGVFRLLSSLNHFGAFMFGAALIGLFLCYPRQIVQPRMLLVAPALLLAWLATDVLRLAPDQDLGMRLPVLLALLCVVLLAVVQWRLTRGDPRARAALSWLSLSVVIGSGLFVLSMVASTLLGWLPPLRQGYAFGFFLIMYGGLALGLRRYRLFELDEWAFRILLWVGSALALLMLDGLLIFALRLEPFASLGIALLVAGFLYLPARSALWRRMVERRRIPEHVLFQSVMDVAFRATESERVDAWHALVRQIFDPLELEAAPSPDDPEAAAHLQHGRPRIRRDGLEMLLPAAASSPPLAVRYPWQGRELFGIAHARLARQLVALMRHADAGRAAHERGVQEERRRVARDLHDDLGAQLLTALHRPTLEETRSAVRDAIGEMRTVVAGLNGERAGLCALLANLRLETAARLESAGISLDWPVSACPDGVELDYRTAKHLASMHRELVSNVIRHSGASRLTVGVSLERGWIEMTVRDDGAGPCSSCADDADAPSASAGRQGNGLRNLGLRIEELGGRWSIGDRAPGCEVRIGVPTTEHGAGEYA